MGNHLYLAPYYSSARVDSLFTRLVGIINELLGAEPDNQAAQRICRNFERWTHDQYQVDKELLLLAIERRSLFALDMVHWIGQLSRLLLAIAAAPPCPEHVKEELRKNARWLVSVLSWVPDEAPVMTFIGTFHIDDELFETGTEALRRGAPEVAVKIRTLLVDYAFKAGRHGDQWGQMESAICGAALLGMIQDPGGDGGFLPSFQVALAENPPPAESRARTAVALRERAERLGIPEHGLDPIGVALERAPHERLGPLLTAIAASLAPIA